MAQRSAFHAIAKRGDLDAVIGYFEQPDVRENVAACNAEHRALRLEKRPRNELHARPWYRKPDSSKTFFHTIAKRGHVEVFRWFLGREQIAFMGETLRAIAADVAMACFGTESKSTTQVLLEIVLESALFTDVMTDDEQRAVLGALLNVAISRRPEWVNVLLAYGADPNYECDGKTPIYAAAYRERIGTLDLLLANGAWFVGNDLLAHRAGDLSWEFACAFLQRGADANATVVVDFIPLSVIDIHTDLAGNSALHAAVRHVALNTVYTLLDEGFADVDARDRHGRTPLIVAAAANERLPMGYLFPRQFHVESKLYVLRRCRVLDMLVNAGANVDAVDDRGRSALHHVVLNARVDYMEWLLERGANPNVQDLEGQTPLISLLRDSGRLVRDRISMLLDAGTDPFTVDRNGVSAVDLLQDLDSKYVQATTAFQRPSL